MDSAPERRLSDWGEGQIWSWIILGCILLFVAAVRFRLRDMPLERDEGEYAYAGQLLLQGILPGKLVYTMKLPGTHAAYAVLMALFGQTCAGIHFGFTLVNCATIALVFLFARTLVSALAGCVAAATYALLSLSADALGTAAHATHFVVLFALAGFLMLWRASKTGRLLQYLASGVLLSISVMMKQNGLLFALFGALWLGWLASTKALGPNVSFAKDGAAFLLGAVAPFVALALLLWAAGTFEHSWFWSVTYARTYPKSAPGVTLLWRMMIQRMPAVMVLPFWAAIFGLATLWGRRGSRSVALFATGLLVFSLIAVVPGFHFRAHYFVLLMPVLALLTGALVQTATELLGGWRFKLLSAVPTLLFAGLLLQGIWRERTLFFQLTPVEACRLLYGPQPFVEALTLADYLRAHSSPDARVAVLGSEPEIYFYSHRRSATGYIYTYPLTERQPFAQQMRQQMLHEIETAQPQFIVQVRTWTSWLSRPGSQKMIDELCDALTPPHYKLIGACDLLPNESRAVWHWYEGGREKGAIRSSELLVFERSAPLAGQ